MTERVPPGRAGRMWIVGRLAAAERGAELLRRKRALLRQEHERLSRLCAETGRRWEAACGEADRWGLRATVLGGLRDRSLATASLTAPAAVTVRWANTMGVRHAEAGAFTAPAAGPLPLAAGNAALAPAARAYGEALAAAVAHAASSDSLRRVDAELLATQRRLRGIERHRLPELRDLLARLELRLEELEREERVTTRWAERHGAGARFDVATRPQAG